MKRGITLLTIALALLLVSCDQVEEGDARISPGGEGELILSLTDKPLDMDTVQSVWITIDSVLVYPAALMEGDDLSPIEIPLIAQTFDLMTLTDGATEPLARANLPSGLYERIRLRTTDERLVFKDGVEEPLKNESEKVDVNITFEIGVDANAHILIDFDAGASIMVNDTGNDKYILRPVVQAEQIN